MAKYTFTGLLDGNYLEDQYGDGTFSLAVDPDGKRAVLTGDDFGMKIVLTGRNLAGTDDLTGGRVTGVSFEDDSGGVFATVLDTSRKAAAIADVLTTKGSFYFIKDVLDTDDIVIGSDSDDKLFGFGGHDKMFGRKGDDWLNGNAGNDVMTGGRGSDTFLFAESYGHDVITDFDADGEGDKQDYLFVRPEFLTDFHLVKNRDGDATLVFGNGATLTLEGVSKAQIDGNDFFVWA